jgi:uncharacterized protein
MRPWERIISLLLFSLLFITALQAAEPVYPNYSGFVNDFTGTIDPATKAKMAALCRDLEAKTSAELAIAVVKTVSPLDTKTYAVKLFEKWKIGKKGKDNGLLVLLALDERRVEIEVGYGLEGVINDAKAGEILDKYGVPYFKEGQFGAGLYNTAAALSEQIATAADQELGDQYRPSGGTKDNWGANDTVLSTAVIMIAIFSIFFSGLMAGVVGALIGGLFGVFLWGPAGGVVGALLGFVVSYFRFFGGRFGGWGGGMFSGGSFGSGGGGGFGGFGGGSSGGGGAGRSW